MSPMVALAALLAGLKIGHTTPPDTQLIDTRDSATFNGWKTEAGEKGGHAPGAKLLSAEWLPHLSSTQLKGLLKEKEMLPDTNYLLYGTTDDVEKVRKTLLGLGYKKLTIISERSIKKRSALPRFQQLVPARWLKKLIQRKQPEELPSGEWKIFEVGWRSAEEFMRSHIAGAGYIDTDEIEVGPMWNFRGDKSLQTFFLKKGIDANTTVILYGRNTMAATRLALALLYGGVKDVRILDGGWDAWLRAEGPKENGWPTPTHPKLDFAKKFPDQPQLVLSIQQTRKILSDKARSTLVSVRSWDEFIGKISGYSDIEEKGEIPGAVWGRAGSDAMHMEDYHNPDGTMRAAEEIKKFWQQEGIVPSKKTVFYCGTGWRASEAFFYAYIFGWKDIAVYDGGWKEWSSDAKNPIRVGRP